MNELELLNGVGNKTVKILNKLGIESIQDLIEYYPFRYEILEKTDINKLEQDDKVVIDGIAERIPNVFFFSKKFNKMEFLLNTGTNIHKIIIFNRAYLKNKINIGSPITVIGKYDKRNNTIVASDIRLSLLPRIPIIEPVYHTTTGITSKEINKLILNNISKIKVEEILPEYLIDRYKLINRKDSILEIHKPKNRESLKKAINYLKYEELFIFMLKMNYLQSIREVSIGLERKVDRSDVDNFIHTLPFELTKDQLSSVDDIYNDLCSIKRMNRLLQGDVGSGKTIVSVIALYINYLSGYQGALMSPTEILAIQHYNNLLNLYKDTNIKVGLLTGKMKTSEKKKIYTKLLSNEIDIIIGTHALFSEDVIYNNLGLVITDEQHRFGVNQRSSLKNKGITPDILYMSATPIPRTYALTIYGDMDISSIHTRPSGRKEVITILKDSKHIKEVLDLIYQELKSKHQIYIIAPLIEESENSDMENVYELKDKFDRAFSKICKTGILHGKMTSKEKDEIMEQYKNNEISILISTTVIEVGVDVKNATVMVIFDSFRFGLSQLHQLRGRVGRNELQSYCVLISDKEAERLNVLTETSDGFKVSEEDFKLRGSGDLFGTRQSGDMKFKLADIKQDFSILLRAKEDSKEVLSSKEYVNDKKYFKLRETLENSINNA